MLIREYQATDSIMFSQLLSELYPMVPEIVLSSKLNLFDKAEQAWVCEENSRIVGRVSIFNNSMIKETRNALIFGAFESQNASTSHSLLNQILKYATNQMASEIIGPINGNTWNDYRLNLNGETPNFPGEPYNPKRYVEDFERFGFQKLKTYSSSTDFDLFETHEILEQQLNSFQKKGITFRGVNEGSLKEDIKHVLNISKTAFKANFLYSDPEIETTRKKYIGLLSSIPHNFITIAEDNGQPIAFMFAYPNPLDRPHESIVIKTVARVPGTNYQGIGQLLVGLTTQKARFHGFKKVIHALMPDDSHSNVISLGHSGNTDRTYALYHLKC
jgi:hypothetical protein